MHRQCPFCDIDMDSGVILDRDSGVSTRPVWTPEPAVEAWFGGLRQATGPAMVVGTFRCPTCGYLASYAGALPIERGPPAG
jgi:hypothetical protein